MIVWWNGLSAVEQVFATIAIPSTLILFLQTIMLLFGLGDNHADMDSHDGGFHFDGHAHMHDFDMHDADMHDFDAHDMDALGSGTHIDTHHDIHDINAHDAHDTHTHPTHDNGLRIFTVRGFVAFFTVFGWAGLFFMKTGLHSAISITIAFTLGSLSMMLVAAAMSLFMKLQNDGTVNVYSAIGASGVVYMTIPKTREGTGKINALVSGRYGEFDAVSDEEKPIATGSSVTIVAVTGNNTFVVIPK